MDMHGNIHAVDGLRDKVRQEGCCGFGRADWATGMLAGAVLTVVAVASLMAGPARGGVQQRPVGGLGAAALGAEPGAAAG